MQRYTTLQYFKRPEYFDIVIAYNVAPGRFRERTEVKVPSQYIQDGRNGRFISKSFPGYLAAIQKINELQDRVEQIVSDYMTKNDHKPDSDWLRIAFDKGQSVEYKGSIMVSSTDVAPVVTQEQSNPTSLSYNYAEGAPAHHSFSQSQIPSTTHALAAKMVRGLGATEPVAAQAHCSRDSAPASQNRPDQPPLAEGDLFRFWKAFMAVRKLVRRDTY